MRVLGDTAYIKIVFFGTALAGKTTILEWLFSNAIPDQCKLVKQLKQLKTSFGQTLFFDFAPIQIREGAVARIYTCTGQDYYRGTRPQILDGADGIFLVVDSQKQEMDHNRELVDELLQYQRTMEQLSESEVVVLFNKQDLDEIHPVEYLQQALGLQSWPGYPTSALTGQNLRLGFLEMLKRLAPRLKL